MEKSVIITVTGEIDPTKQSNEKLPNWKKRNFIKQKPDWETTVIEYPQFQTLALKEVPIRPNLSRTANQDLWLKVKHIFKH